MKYLIKTPALLLLIFIAAIMAGCAKTETTKKEPILTWSNPEDIAYGTLLDTTQLNATAEVAGTFTYTPASGTKLPAGSNQDLDVYFSPADASAYKTATKTVKINVIYRGISHAIFNPNLTYGTMSDIDGNIYKTITIGTQVWMAENLRTTRYRNGDSIPEVSVNLTWKNLTTHAYCNYGNTSDPDKIATYGRLYNWFAVSDSRNIAPTGWHVASDAEWATLTTYLGNENVSGAKLKETGLSHWITPNTGATNASGFTALPGGRREYTDGTFINLGTDGFWWTRSAYNPDYSWYRYLHYDVTNIYRANFHKQYGFSVRCIQD